MAMLLKYKQVVSVIYDASLNTTNLLAARRDTTITRATVSAVRFRPRLLRGGQHIGIALVPRNAGLSQNGGYKTRKMSILACFVNTLPDTVYFLVRCRACFCNIHILFLYFVQKRSSRRNSTKLRCHIHLDSF